MRQACTPHKGQQAVGDDEITWTSSSWVEGVTCSMWSPSDRGRNGDPSIFLHLVLHKSFSLENNRERDFHPQTSPPLAARSPLRKQARSPTGRLYPLPCFFVVLLFRGR